MTELKANPNLPYKIFRNGELIFQCKNFEAGHAYYERAAKMYKECLVVLKHNFKILLKSK